MVNHYHLIAETVRANLGRWMHWLTTGYTIYFNRRYRQCSETVAIVIVRCDLLDSRVIAGSQGNPPVPRRTPSHVYAPKLCRAIALFLASVCAIACETVCFAVDTDRDAAAVQHSAGVTVGGGVGW